jgi:hypothetical protein
VKIKMKMKGGITTDRKGREIPSSILILRRDEYGRTIEDRIGIARVKGDSGKFRLEISEDGDWRERRQQKIGYRRAELVGMMDGGVMGGLLDLWIKSGRNGEEKERPDGSYFCSGFEERELDGEMIGYDIYFCDYDCLIWIWDQYLREARFVL